MTWWIASLVSNVAIIWTEYLYRNATSGWDVFPKVLPLVIVAQLCLFRAFNGAPHWFLAWAVFTIGNSIMRASAVGLMGEEVKDWTMVIFSISIMMGGAFMMKTALK